jgi:outer membrane receptor for ferrienterochelin and colicins
VATPSAPASAPTQRIVVEGRNDDADMRRRQSTVAMQVVGRDELEAHGDTSVLDVLQRVPGITIEGETPRLRGMGAGYTQILINGEPAPPGFTLDSLAPSEIERIEIVKGPTAEFGGAAGTINIILRSPPKLRQREWRGAVGYRAVRPQGSTSFNWGDRVGAVGLFLPVSVYSWANAGDLAVQRVSRSSAGVVTRQQVQGRDEWLGGGINLAPRLDWKIDGTDTLQWQAFLQRNENDNRSRRETAAIEGPPPWLAEDASRSQATWELARSQLQWVRKAEDGSRLELKGTAQASLWGNASLAQGVTPAGSTGTRRETSASHRERSGTAGLRWRRPWGESHTLNLGLDADTRHRREFNRRFDDGLEQITGSVGSPFRAAMRKRVAFVQDEWALSDRLSATGGLRAESVAWRVSGPAGDTTNRYRVLAPVLQGRLAFDAQGRDVLRVSAARSVRAPDVGLLLPRYSLNGSYDKDTPNTPIAADSAGNPALQPERIWAFELNAEHALDGGGVISAGLFHREVRELIRRRITLETVPEASVPRWVSRPGNLGSARSSGVEVEIKGQAPQLLGRWWAGAPKALQLRAALSLFRSSVEQIDDPDARLEGQPPWRLTLGFDHRAIAPAWSLGMSLGVTPGFSTQQTDRQRVWRNASRRLDAYLLWRIERQASLRLAVNNAVPEDSLSRSEVEDLDGFAASSLTRRTTVTQTTATLQWRF